MTSGLLKAEAVSTVVVVDVDPPEVLLVVLVLLFLPTLADSPQMTAIATAMATTHPHWKPPPVGALLTALDEVARLADG